MSSDREELSDHDRINFLAGEVEGLEAALFAMVAINPDRARFAAAMKRTDLVAVANATGNSPSEQYINGMRRIFDRIIEVCNRLP